MDRLNRRWQRRRGTGLTRVGLVSLELYSKSYAGPAADWVNNALDGVFCR